MRCWASANRFRWVTLIALLLGACADRGDQLAIIGLEHPAFRAPELVLHLELPAALQRGLERGVPLTFRLDIQRADGQSTYWRELRFMPLARQYQVRENSTGYRRSYPSRSAALSALERWSLPDLPGDAAFSARARLDTTRLPAPLVLPALFLRDWSLDSGTKAWPLTH